eukprot:EG_transcript_11987
MIEALWTPLDGAEAPEAVRLSFRSPLWRPKPEPLCPGLVPGSAQSSPRGRQSPLPRLSPTAEAGSPPRRTVYHFRRSGSCSRLGPVARSPPAAFSLQRAVSACFQGRCPSLDEDDSSQGAAAASVPGHESSFCESSCLSEAVSREGSLQSFSPQQRRPREVRFVLPGEEDAAPLRASSMSPRGPARSPSALRSGNSADAPHPSPKVRLCGPAATGLRMARVQAS